MLSVYHLNGIYIYMYSISSITNYNTDLRSIGGGEAINTVIFGFGHHIFESSPFVTSSKVQLDKNRTFVVQSIKEGMDYLFGFE